MLFKKYIFQLVFRFILIFTSTSLLTGCSAEKTVSAVKSAGKSHSKQKQLRLKMADSQSEVTSPVNDGPYIFKQAEKLQAFWLCDGTVETRQAPAAKCACKQPLPGLSAAVTHDDSLHAVIESEAAVHAPEHGTLFSASLVSAPEVHHDTVTTVPP